MRTCVFVRTVLILLFLIQMFYAEASSYIDNINGVYVFTDTSGTYLLVNKDIYTPYTAEYKRGNIAEQGFLTSILSVYRLSDGKLITEKVFGKKDSLSITVVLGCSGKGLWIYSKKYHSGLQSLNPVTLNRQMSEAGIYKSVDVSFGKLIEPQSSDITNNYAFDPVSNSLIVTNINKKLFFINTDNYVVEPVNGNINIPFGRGGVFNESVALGDIDLSLDGYDKRVLFCNGSKVSGMYFLYGQFVLEQKRLKAFDYYKNTGDKKTLDYIVRGNMVSDFPLLSKDSSLYIMSKSRDSKDAFFTISKIQTGSECNILKMWAVELPGMFFNVSASIDTRKFHQYFGDFVPSSDYKYVISTGENVVIIYLNQIICIDDANGTILWRLMM